MKNQAFTLIELLVVVLIIGILAAIAVPQYQKAVLKANLHKGVSLVESLYQAQQSYFLAKGEYTYDLDKLDVSVPYDKSCVKATDTVSSSYDCKYGKISLINSSSNIQFKSNDGQIAYAHYYQERTANDMTYKKGVRYCYAKPDNSTAQSVCKNMGGVLAGSSASWTYYELY